MAIQKTINILIVEDYDSVSLGLIRYLEASKDYHFEITKTTNVLSAIKVIEQKAVDVILLDFFLKSDQNAKGDGDALLFRLRKMKQNPKVIIYSKSDSLEILDYLIYHLNVDGFILKSRDSLEEIIPAIELVLEGKRFFSPSINSLLRYHVSQLEIDFTDRLILKAFSQGVKQMELIQYLAAHHKQLSLSGLEKRIHRLKLKFDAATLAELVTLALRKGLI